MPRSYIAKPSASPKSRKPSCGSCAPSLAPVYGWFTEGFETPDLKEAKALLETLDA
jgi:hypothetical protein